MESVGRLWAYKEVKEEQFVWCSVLTVLVRTKYISLTIKFANLIVELGMHVWATKYELCNFGDSVYKLNGCIFGFKVGVAQCKNEW